MVGIDWRKLYAHNQAAIAAAGTRPPAGTSPDLPMRALASSEPDWPHHPPVVARRALGNRIGNQPATTPSPRRRPHVEDRVLVHVPADLDRSVPVAAVCMLHGCTQDPSKFAAATAMNKTADRHGFVVFYPGQPRARNAQGCWNWFLPTDQQRGAGEPELIARTTRRLIANEFGQAVDPARIFVAGLSSGGAMALILAVCYPDLFAAVAIHSGLPYRSADDIASAFAAMRLAESVAAPDGHQIRAAMGEHVRVLPSLVIHGTADRTVAPENRRRMLAQLMHANHLAAPATCQHDPGTPSASGHARADGGLHYTHDRWVDTNGALLHESVEVHGLGHAWSGGVPAGSYTDPRGPSASETISAFFSQAGHPIQQQADQPSARHT